MLSMVVVGGGWWWMMVDLEWKCAYLYKLTIIANYRLLMVPVMMLVCRRGKMNGLIECGS
jgi:hypothetical protein